MFKKLKSLFIIEEETTNTGSASASPEEKTADDPKANAADVKFEKPSFDKANPPKGKLDEKFVDRLLGAIDDNNLDGFDYLEYKQALQNLKNVEMDEATKYRSALAVAKTMGANKKVLESSALHYLKVLEKEEHKFVEAYKNQIQKQVNARSNQSQKLEQSIEAKKKKIEQLKKEIEADTKKLKESQSTIEAARKKVDQKKDGFYRAYHVVTEQIRTDLDKIARFLSD